MKASLIAHSSGLVYTPTNEHFGIVPLEAMALGKPVIADNTGGPRESIIPGETGYLCDTWEEYGSAMIELFEGGDLGEKMGKKGSQRVEEVFSFDSFSKQVNNDIVNLKKSIQLQVYLPFVVILIVLFVLFHYHVCLSNNIPHKSTILSLSTSLYQLHSSYLPPKQQQPSPS